MNEQLLRLAQKGLWWMWWVAVAQASLKGQLYFDGLDRGGINRAGAHGRGAQHQLKRRRCWECWGNLAFV